MKVTFENDEEEFIFYAHRAIEAKEAGNEEEYLANLKIAEELRKKLLANVNEVELKKIDNIIPR